MRKRETVESIKGKAANSTQGNSHKTQLIFFAEILQIRREWHHLFKVMKGKNLQPRIIYQQGSDSDLMKRLKAL